MSYTDPMSIVEKPVSGKLLRWFILLAIVLFIVSVVLLIFGKSSFSEKDVVLQLKGPEQAYSGDQATYTLTYQNRTNYTLYGLKFRFVFPPDSVVLRDGIPTDDLAETFEVDELAPDDSASREFTAFLVGDRGNIKEAKTTMTFNAGNLKPLFEKNVTAATPIVGLPVALTLSAPPTATSGQDIIYTLDYRNETAEDISNLTFELKTPDGFTVRRVSPESNAGRNIWNVPLLKRGSGARITIEGVLTGNERDVKNIDALVKRKVGEQLINYVKASSSTVISSPLLGVSIVANGSPDYTAVAGDTLRYVVNYRNSYNQGLVGLTLSVRLEGDMLDFATLHPEKGFFDGITKTIVWNAGALPEFASLAPGQAGTVNFDVKLKSTFPSTALGVRNFFVKATAILSTPNVPSGLDLPEVVSQSNLITKISTQPTLTQLVYYNDPVFGMAGPLPMQTDTETVFTVHWQLANPGNDLNDATVKATLPPGVVWKNQVSAGTNQPLPVFDRNRSEVSWKLGLLAQGVGIYSPKYDGIFRVGVTPGINERGHSITLLKNIVMSGADSFTKRTIVVTASDAVTQVLVDRPNEGTVQ